MQNRAFSVLSIKALDDDALCEEIYLSTFSRRPSAEERETITAFVKRNPQRSEAVRDLLWTLFNTQEFLFQH